MIIQASLPGYCAALRRGLGAGAAARDCTDLPWSGPAWSGRSSSGARQPVYQRWLAQRPALLNDQRYVEVKAEELAARWPASRSRLFARLSLPDADTSHAFITSRLGSRDGQLTDPEHREVLSRLRWAAEELGYETTP